MEAELFNFLESLGLPGAIIASLLFIWKYGPERRAQDPATQMAEALNALRSELTVKVDGLAEDLGDLKDQTIDRLARVETEVKNLKERK